MDNLILNVIAKVRQIGKYYPDIKDVVNCDADIKMTEKNGNLTVDYIKFDNYDEVWVNDGGITFIPYDTRNRKVLFAYNGWDELLAL